MIQIDRIRLTAVAKNQLITLKRKTGINHYNTFCRYAFCISIGNTGKLPTEKFNFDGGIDIDWRTFTGGYEALYLNLLFLWMDQERLERSDIVARQFLNSHIHRGLSFMSSMSENELNKKLNFTC